MGEVAVVEKVLALDCPQDTLTRKTTLHTHTTADAQRAHRP